MGQAKHGSNRRRLPETRFGITHHGVRGNTDYYVTVNFYDDQRTPGEIFVKIAKQGSDIKGWVDAWATTTSIALQYGVPWAVLFEKAEHTRFGEKDPNEPSLALADESKDKISSPSMLHAIAITINYLIDLAKGDGRQRLLLRKIKPEEAI